MYFQAAVRLIMKMGGGHWGLHPQMTLTEPWVLPCVEPWVLPCEVIGARWAGS